VLLGLSMPADTARLAGVHGLLMTLGFLGTMISLERAVALDRTWGYLAPLATGLGGIALVAGAPIAAGTALLAVGGVVFALMYVAFDRIERSLHTSIQALGAVAWAVSAVLLLAGRSVGDVVPWLAGFLVLTIAGERLELSRLARLTAGARRLFIVVALVFAAGVTVTTVAPDTGTRIAGLGLIGLAAWLARNDLARRTVRGHGVTRFVALSLLAGYAWLAVGGATWLVFGEVTAGGAHDTMLHAIFLGFVISMVFGHAPVILPAVLRTPLPWHDRFYVHLVLLHVGLLVRIVGGDLLGSTTAWQTGGVLNVTALLVFVASSAAAIVASYSRRLAPRMVRTT
ncbi:MAG: hypothetical protein ACRDGQ_09865, partial [Candidatus Limnocylindrales bacterium]